MRLALLTLLAVASLSAGQVLVDTWDNLTDAQWRSTPDAEWAQINRYGPTPLPEPTGYLEMLLQVTEPGAALLGMTVYGLPWRVFVCDTDMEYVLLHFGERIESAPVVVPPLTPEKPGNPQEPAETPIPEPSMWLLVLGGLCAFLIYFRLRWPPAPLCR